MYDWLSVATTGLSDVASPLRPMTKSLPAARPDWGVRPMTATRNAIRMAWITAILRSCVRLSSVCTSFYHGDWPHAVRAVGGSGAGTPPAEARLDNSRIRCVAQPVAEQVEAQHGDEDGQAGERGDPPGRGQELPALDDHVAPARQRRLSPQPEVAQARLDQDRLAQQEAGLDDHDRQRVDEQVASEDARVTGPERRRGVDEVSVAKAQALAAHHAPDRRPGDERDHECGVSEARAEERDDDEDQEERRNGEEDIGGAHDRGVDATAEVASDAPNRGAHDERQRSGGQADLERDAAAPDYPAQDVAAEAVGSEPVHRARRLEPVQQRLRRVALRRQDWRQRAGRDHGGDHDAADEPAVIAREPSQGRRPFGARLDGHWYEIRGSITQ